MTQLAAKDAGDSSICRASRSLRQHAQGLTRREACAQVLVTQLAAKDASYADTCRIFNSLRQHARVLTRRGRARRC